MRKNKGRALFTGCTRGVALIMAVILSLHSCTPINSSSEEDILKICDETDKNLNAYTMKSMEGYPEPEKRKFIAYYKGKAPRLLVEEYFADTARVFTRFYLDGDQLIFVFQQHFLYNRPVYMTEDSARKLGDTVWYDDHKTRIESMNFLFTDNKLKKWVGGNKNEIPHDETLYMAREEELMGNCLLMLKMFKTQEN